LAYISAAESIRVSSTTFTQSAHKATEFGEITQPLGLLRHSISFKVTEFGTNRKLICDFLLVINSNLSPILQFPRYSLGKVQNRYIFLPLFGLTPRRRGSSGTIAINFLPKVTDGQSTKWLKIWPKISIAWVGCTNVTDDRQTDDRRTTTYSESKRSLKSEAFSVTRQFFKRIMKDTNVLRICVWIAGKRGGG